jgi:hypothetical protein
MSAIANRVLIVILLTIFGSFTVFAQRASGKSDREKEGLAGPVSSVKIVITDFKNEDGRLVESERRVVMEYEFDRSGKRLFTQRKPVLGDPKLCDEKFKYDEKGREKEKSCLGDSKERVLEKYTYEEDRFGNWTKKVTSVPDVGGKTFYNKYTLYREIEYFE